MFVMCETILWVIGCITVVFSFRLWNIELVVFIHWQIVKRQWCVHIHATDQSDPSVPMHRVVPLVRLFFVLCLVPVSGQFSSIRPLAENCSKLHAIHSMRRGAGRGQPSGPKQLPLSLGFKCTHCMNEYGSRLAMDVHHRHSTSVGTPCADPKNHKSMSMTARGDQAVGVLRQHDTLGVLPIPAFYCSENAEITYRE